MDWELYSPVPVADAVVYPGAVVVEVLDASVTDLAVFAPAGLHCTTRVTQTAKGIVPLLPLIEVRYLHTR